MSRVTTLESLKVQTAQEHLKRVSNVVNTISNNTVLGAYLKESMDKHKNSNTYKNAKSINDLVQQIDKGLKDTEGDNVLLPAVQLLLAKLEQLSVKDHSMEDLVDQLTTQLSELSKEIELYKMQVHHLEEEIEQLKKSQQGSSAQDVAKEKAKYQALKKANEETLQNTSNHVFHITPIIY